MTQSFDLSDDGISEGDRVRYRPEEDRRSQPRNTDDDGYVYGTVADADVYCDGKTAAVEVDRKYYKPITALVPEPKVDIEHLEVVDDG